MESAPEYVPRVGAGVRIQMDSDHSMIGNQNLAGTFLEFNKSEGDDYLLVVQLERPLRLLSHLFGYRLIALKVAGTWRTQSYHGQVYGVSSRNWVSGGRIALSALVWLGQADFEFTA
jgi:hypothetical protein